MDLNRTSKRSSHKELYRSCKRISRISTRSSLRDLYKIMQGAPREDLDLLTRICRRGFHRDLTELAVEMRADISDEAVYAKFPMRMCQAKTGTTPGPTLCARCKYIPHVLNRLVKQSRGQQIRCQDKPE